MNNRKLTKKTILILILFITCILIIITSKNVFANYEKENYDYQILQEGNLKESNIELINEDNIEQANNISYEEDDAIFSEENVDNYHGTPSQGNLKITEKNNSSIVFIIIIGLIILVLIVIIMKGKKGKK